jgi:hypothetical protein
MMTTFGTPNRFLWSIFLIGQPVHEKFMNFAGQPCARLDRDQAVYEIEEKHRTALITILSPLLFFAPDVHLSALEKVYIDELINQVPWKKLTSKLTEEWREFVLYSTVLRESVR